MKSVCKTTKALLWRALLLLSIFAPINQAAAGLISWWPAEGDATDIQDGNDGVLRNGATFAAGKVGQAFSFDGVDDYVFVGNPANLKITQSITLAAWIKPEDLSPNVSDLPSLGVGQIAVVISKWGQSASLDSYWLGIAKRFDGTIGLNGGIGNGTPQETPFLGDIQPHVWNHVAMTYDANDGFINLYVNGIPVGAHARPGGISTSDLNVLIGREDSFKPRYFPGLIDEVQIYDRALSAAEIRTSFASSASIPEPPTLLLFGAGVLGLIGYGSRRRMQAAPSS